MALGLGLHSWAGIGEESTYGTLVARTKFLEIVSENIKVESPRTPRDTLTGASRKYYRPGKIAVAGDIVHELGYEGAELLFKHLFGSVASVQQAATAAYKHSFTLADAPPVGLSVEINKGDVSGFFYEGCHIGELKLAQAVDEPLQAAWSIIGQAETRGAKSTPTFPTDRPADWDDVITATIGGVTIGLKSMELTFNNALADDRYILGSRDRKGIGRGAARAVSGSLVAEFETLTEYEYFTDEDEKVLIFTWRGALIASTFYHQIDLTLNRAIFVGETPEVGGEGPMEVTLNFEAFYDVAGAKDEIAVDITNTLASV